MNLIYKITNKVNNKIYIGKTNNLKRRNNQHKSDSYNPNCGEYYTYLARAIRKYGWENFEVTVIKNNIVDSEIDNEERKYIKLFNSTNSDIGYNLTEGGEGGHGKIGSKYDVKGIEQDLMNSDLKIKDIAVKYGCSYPFVTDINNGYKHKNDKLQYPLRKDPKTFVEDSIDEIIDLLYYTKYSMSNIAKYIGCSIETIRKINKGKQDYLKDYPISFPIRNQTRKEIIQKPVEANWRESWCK